MNPQPVSRPVPEPVTQSVPHSEAASAPAPVAARRTSKGDRRRENILTAAVELFAVQGYRQTSLRDIAERVGITHPGLLYHFGTKQELLAAVLSRRDQTNEQVFALGSQAGPREQLRRLLELAAHNATSPGIIELFATLSAEASDPEHPAHDFFAERYRRVVAANQAIFDELAARSELAEGVEVRNLGAALTALWDGLQVQWLYHPDSFEVSEVLRSHLNGLLRTPL